MYDILGLMLQGFILCVSSLGVCIKTLLFFEEEAGGSDRGEAAHRVFYLRVFLFFVLVWVCCFVSGALASDTILLVLACWQA